MKRLWLILCVTLLAWPQSEASAAEHQLSGTLHAGYAFPLRDAEGAFPGGPDLSLGLRYQTASGVGVHFAGSWARLFSQADRALDDWILSAGLSLDWWRLRLDAGLGVSFLSLHATVGDEPIAPVEPALTYSLGVTTLVYEGPLDVGVRLQSHVVSGTKLAWITLGVTLGVDLFTSPDAPPGEEAPP